MPRRCRLGLGLAILFSTLLSAVADDALWREYGLIHSQTSKRGKLNVTTYEMKDLTGALAAWEWLRSPNAQTCDLAPFCTRDGDRTVVADDNYVLVFEGGLPRKADIDAVSEGLPDKRDTALPALLTFLPRRSLVPNSARYVLGPASLRAFAPELAGLNLGFDHGAEAQVASYKLENEAKPVRLAIFYYPTPEMARLGMAQFRGSSDVRVKRSGVLLAAVLGSPTEQEATSLLHLVEYEAKITWNDTPPPPPMKPLYRLLLNIVYLSCVLAGICFVAGLMYAGMRVYRRRYGRLESEEAMTTLRLSGD